MAASLVFSDCTGSDQMAIRKIIWCNGEYGERKCLMMRIGFMRVAEDFLVHNY